MPEKRILVIDSEVLKKIDENRGDLGRSEFINLLIDSQVKEEPVPTDCVSQQEFHHFAQGMKDLMRNFLEFFISYGVELGDQPKDHVFEELTKKLQLLEEKAKK